jgi:hypothetical protein
MRPKANETESALKGLAEIGPWLKTNEGNSFQQYDVFFDGSVETVVFK